MSLIKRKKSLKCLWRDLDFSNRSHGFVSRWKWLLLHHHQSLFAGKWNRWPAQIQDTFVPKVGAFYASKNSENGWLAEDQSGGVDRLDSCDAYSSVSLPAFQSSIPEFRGVPGNVPASWESALSSLNGYSFWCMTHMLNTTAAKPNKTPPSTRLSCYIVCASFKVEFFF